MAFKEKIQEDLKSNLKEKKELEVSTLRQILAAVLTKEKEKRYRLSKENPELKENDLEKEKQLTDEEIINVISSETKKRKEAIGDYEKGNRGDLAEKEKKELNILERYLPEQLSEEELKKLVKEAIDSVGAKEMKDMGRVMAELMPKIKGAADGSLISKTVRDSLLGQK